MWASKAAFPRDRRRGRPSPSIKQTPPRETTTREFECKPARRTKRDWSLYFESVHGNRENTSGKARIKGRAPTTRGLFSYAKMPTAAVEFSPLVGSWPFRSWCLDAFLRLLNSRDPGGPGSLLIVQVCLSTIWLGTNYGSLLGTSIRKPKWLWGRSSPLHYCRMCLFRPRLRSAWPSKVGSPIICRGSMIIWES